jgi:peroxin-1
MARDLYKVIDSHGSDILETIKEYKSINFTQSQSITDSAADWDTEIGGLLEAKTRVEEIFGIAQRFSIFFKDQRVS